MRLHIAQRDVLFRGLRSVRMASRPPQRTFAPRRGNSDGPHAVAPPVTTAYDPGCGYEQTYGYGSYPVEGPSMIDSGWSSSCPDCSGPSYSLPSDSGSSYQYDSGSTSTIDPGPAN